jgi:RNA polymerase sigma factor (sigma-70 family)
VPAPGEQAGKVVEQVRTLFSAGAVGGLTDGQLLERFARRGGEGDAAEAAFAALIDRHGPMVLDVCRSVLGDWHDAEDAFQATFLVLARRANSIRKGESVASWLFGVARRVSLKARAGASRRRERERRGAVRPDGAAEEAPPHEPPPGLLEELDRLPEKYRAPIVLCLLEGRSYEEAAGQLGWRLGTVKSRLSRGRDRLRGRLVRRGLAPAVALAVVGEARAAPATPLCSLSSSTARAAPRFASGRSTDGLASAPAVALARSFLGTLLMARLLVASGALILGLVATGVAVLALPRDEPGPAAEPLAQTDEGRPSAPAELARETRSVYVRVVDARGRAVFGVDVDHEPNGGRSRTDEDGLARFTVDVLDPITQFRASPDETSLGWARPDVAGTGPKGTEDDPVLLTLLPRDRKVEGLVVDTSGRPVAGAIVRVAHISHPDNGFGASFAARPQPSPLGSAATDGSGRYTLMVPEGAAPGLAVYHPRYIDSYPGLRPPVDWEGPLSVLQEAGRIVGTVVDAASGEPAEGVKVGAQQLERRGYVLGSGWGDAVSDASGRFEVGGLAAGVYNLLFVESPKDRRFTARGVEGVRVETGQEARADLALIEGRRLLGAVLDAVTGQPLGGVSVSLYSAARPRSGAACQNTKTDERGDFEFFVPPGPARVYIAETRCILDLEQSRRTLDVPAEADPAPVSLRGIRAPEEVRRAPDEPLMVEAAAPHHRLPMPPVETGRTLRGRVIDQAGRPLVGARLHSYEEGYRGLAEEGYRGLATDREGIFLMRDAPAGDIVFNLEREGYARSRAMVIAGGAEPVEITLARQPEDPK